MLASMIKFCSIYFFSFYFIHKNIYLSNKPVLKFYTIPISFVLALITYFLEQKIPALKYLIPVLLLWLVIVIFSNNITISFNISTFSFVINCSLYGLSSFFIAFISFIANKGVPVFSYTILATLSCLLQGLLIVVLLKIKRLQNGLLLLNKTPFINLSNILCLLFCIILTQAHIQGLFAVALLTCPLLLAFLIYWWQAQITKSYRRSLELRELESLRTELQEKNAAMMRVMEESERVHFINHRDNGLLTTLDYATMAILEMDFSDEKAVKARCKELAAEIHRARDRRVTTVHTDKIEVPRYETGITLLNLLLNRTSKRALDEHVLFTVHNSTELTDFIPNAISDDDLVYLLSDLLDNAFVATENVSSRMIQLQFYKWKKHLVIEIADNGIPFEVDSILQMGIERLTTHEDTGGTGVGLMDIWKIKEKYGATYHLDEYEAAAPFAKKISLTFDKKNRYSVRTYRKSDILSHSKRIDLQVYGQNEV